MHHLRNLCILSNHDGIKPDISAPCGQIIPHDFSGTKYNAGCDQRNHQQAFRDQFYLLSVFRNGCFVFSKIYVEETQPILSPQAKPL